MSLLINSLHIRVLTEAGMYGTNIEFSSGLNVLHAPNSSGKSLCLMAILYGLGLEGAFTSRQTPLLPYAMTDTLTASDGERLPVLQSWIELRVRNGRGDEMTVRRSVKDPTRDTRLVTALLQTSSSSDSSQQNRLRDYYVRRPGSAHDEAGFHHFLAGFLDYDLPEVPKYDGGRSRLYLECLVPVFFVEQKLGWRSTQLRMPTYLGIRDVARRAVEFILGLDAAEREIERARLDDAKRDLSDRWKRHRESYLVSLRACRAQVVGIPTEPVPSLDGLHNPELHVLYGDRWVPVAEAKQGLSSELDYLTNQEIPRVSEVATQLETKLNGLRDELHSVSLKYQAFDLDVRSQQEEIRATDRRLRSIEIDLQRNQQAKVLVEMGSALPDLAVNDACPTCGQSVADSLLPQDPADVPMTLDDNISYLRGQQRLFEQVKRDAEGSLRSRLQHLESLKAESVGLRRSIRAVVESLNADGRQPSVEAIRHRLQLQDRADELEKAEELFASLLLQLNQLTEECAAVDAASSRLGKVGPSSNDTRRLFAFESLLQTQLSEYGFSSISPTEVQLSETLYRPVHDGFDLNFDVSASDMIRVLWAYLLGLFDVGSDQFGRHPGLLIFDEPKQQSTSIESFMALLDRAAAFASDRQILITTSEDSPLAKQKMMDVSSNYLYFDGPILRKLM